MNHWKRAYSRQREVGGCDHWDGTRVLVFQAHEKHSIKGVYGSDTPTIEAIIAQVNVTLWVERKAYLSIVLFERGRSSSWGKAWRS